MVLNIEISCEISIHHCVLQMRLLVMKLFVRNDLTHLYFFFLLLRINVLKIFITRAIECRTRMNLLQPSIIKVLLIWTEVINNVDYCLLSRK